MAVMASPQQSDSTLLDNKPAVKMASLADEKREENGVNGHVSPSPNGVKSPEPLTKTKFDSVAAPESAADPASEIKNDAAFAANKDVDTTAKPATESASPKASEEKEASALEEPKEAAPLSETKETAPAVDTTKDDSPDKPAQKAAAEDTEMADATDTAESKTEAEKAVDANPAEVAPADTAEPTEATQDSATSAGTDSTAEPKPQPPSLSDLAIASQKSDTADTSMTDAPAAPAKVARERDEDSVDEPAAKRARTEPLESETEAQREPGSEAKLSPKGEPAPAEADGSAVKAEAEESKPEPPAHGTETKDADTMDVDELTLGSDRVPPYPDAEPGNLMHPGADDEPIPESAVRAIKNVLSGVKKTKAGGSFKDSVANLWPMLSESYSAKVANPMDIGMMERKLRASQYATLGEFKADVKLLVTNSIAFNGPSHTVTDSAVSVVENIWDRMHKAKVDEPSKVPKKDKLPSMRHTERAAALPRPKPVSTPALVAPAASVSSSNSPNPLATAKPKVDKAPTPKVVETPIHAAPAARRDSTKDDDRPKRPIHPPKKDLGYDPKGSKKKKLTPELRFCDDLLKDLMKPKNQVIHWPFLNPVDEVRDGAVGYYQLIKKPMDLAKMTAKLHGGAYTSAEAFRQDFELLLDNCFTFNPPMTEVNNVGKNLELWFKDKWVGISAYVAKASSKVPRRASASSPGAGIKDESDDEAAASDAEAEQEISPQNEEIQELQRATDALESKIRDARKEQVDLLKADVPDMAQVDIQHSIIMMLTNGLAEKKKKLEELLASRPVPKPKSAPKPKKSASTAANSAPAPKKSSGGPSKKSGGGGGGKKAGGKRQMTSIEKEAIANGINDLDGTYITQAIEVIKKDTHQEENGDGELELEIEQLSTDALHKLYDIMCKGIKGFRARVEAQLRDVQQVALQAPSSAAAPGINRPQKPKKNKPMGKGEQERKLEQLAKLKTQYQQKGRQSSGSQEPPPSREMASSAAAEPTTLPGDDSDVSSEED